MSQTFVHLHLHTEYSLVDSILRINRLVGAVRDAGMPAVAVTEQGNLFSLVKFYQAAQRAGIKPLVGVEVLLRNEGDAQQPSSLVLLCQDAYGYRALSRLVTRSYVEGQSRGIALIHRDWLAGASNGLIALSGALCGDIGQAISAGRHHEAERRLAYWLEVFPNRFYLEVQRTGREGEGAYLDEAIKLGEAFEVPLVATNDVRFATAEDFEAHEARVCIQEGRLLADPRRPRRYSDQQYLRSPAEMMALFSDIPEAIDNSVEIAKRCNLELRLGEYFLPEYPCPEGTGATTWLVEQARAGLKRRLHGRQLSDSASQEQRAYDERLATELEVITGMGYAGYFLIVADFIRWARDNGVRVGPGRGSGAGSLVAYSLGITDLDPLQYELLFERFLNPERVSLPDFDIDFCMEGRDRVIEYVTERYGGSERVSQIITFGTMAAKAVVRDVGRVLGYPFGFVDQLAKLIPFDLGMTLNKALQQEPALNRRYEDEEDVRTLIDLAQMLEGLVRNAGRHAGGVVIAPTALSEYTPLYCEQGSNAVVTQLDKDDVESVGLVKFDFLGLRTLTIIDWAVASINRERAERGEPLVDIGNIATDDPKTYELIKRGSTTAVFQLESRGMKDLIRRLQPDCFEDTIALVALFRPGPLQSGMVDDFIERKHGKARVSYPHPDLESILKTTYGVILYQEQVMQIAQSLAGYTLGGADILRRAMGKKKPEEMAKQRAVFLEGARKRAVPDETASYVFDLMEKFAGYGFNKSHSAAYALIAYQTAWLKAHHPAAYMAAVLSADMDQTEKVVGLLEECREMELSVLPPDVNACGYAFSAPDETTVRYGLGAIKGAGRGAIEVIIEDRERGGPFEALVDFCRRVDTRRANRRVLEALIRSGAMDALGSSRAGMFAELTQALQAAEQHARDQSTGQVDLFARSEPALVRARPLQTVPEWPDEERLRAEKETLGVYLTGHPIVRFEQELDQFITARLAEMKPNASKKEITAGFLVQLRTRAARNGRLAFLTLDDRTARLECVVYPEVYERCRDQLVKDSLVVAVGEITVDEFVGGNRMVVQELYDIDTARERYAKQLSIRVRAEASDDRFLQQLASVLTPFRDGRTPVSVDYRRPEASARYSLGEQWRVRPTEELLQRLRNLAGRDTVSLEY